MSAAATTISWGTRYRITTSAGVSTMFAATGGELTSAYDPSDVTDSEQGGGRLRKSGVYEAELTIRGNIASDVAPHSSTLAIGEGTYVAKIEIFFNGINNPADVLKSVYCDRWRKTSGPNLSEPNHFEFHGYTAIYIPDQ